MVRARATVADVALMHRHVSERAKRAEDPTEKNMLNAMASIVSPANMIGFYRSETLGDKNITSRLPAHLTEFDLYNIATQVRSHTHDTTRSTTRALDMLSSNLMFGHNVEQQKAFAVTDNKIELSYFSDPETAFFGV
jgi:hypothetical protein